MATLEIILPVFYGQRHLKFTAPECFDKVNRKQLLQLVRALFSEFPDPEKKILATKALFNLKWWHIPLFTSVELAYINNKYSSWVFEPESNLTDNKIETIRTGLFHKKLYGPVGDFNTLTANEWTAADSAFTAYAETSEIEHLDNLIAILWRPLNTKVKPYREDFKNDFRIPYNSHTVEKRAERIAGISMDIKFAILLWYKGSRKIWEEIFDKVFSGGTKEQVENYGWPETIQKVSGTKFGSLAETETTYMYKILFNMQIDIKDYDYWKMKNESRNA